RAGDSLTLVGYVLVQHELTRSPASRCNSESVHEVIQPRLQHLEQYLAGNALLPRGVDEQLGKLPLEQAVDVLGLLLFCQLYGVFGLLAFLASTVLPRRIVFLLERFVLAHNGLVKPPRNPDLGPCIPCHNDVCYLIVFLSIRRRARCASLPLPTDY